MNTHRNSNTPPASQPGNPATGATAVSGHADSGNAPAAAAQPSFLSAFTVEEFQGANGKTGKRWTRIGVAFPHKDGTGLNLELHALPVNGRIVLLPPDTEDRDDTSTDSSRRTGATVGTPPTSDRRYNPASRR